MHKLISLTSSARTRYFLTHSSKSFVVMIQTSNIRSALTESHILLCEEKMNGTTRTRASHSHFYFTKVTHLIKRINKKAQNESKSHIYLSPCVHILSLSLVPIFHVDQRSVAIMCNQCSSSPIDSVTTNVFRYYTN